MAGKKLYAVNYNLKIVDIFEKKCSRFGSGEMYKVRRAQKKIVKSTQVSSHIQVQKVSGINYRRGIKIICGAYEPP